MKTIKIGLDEAMGQMQVPVAIDLSFATSAKLDDMGILEQVLAKAVDDVLKRFEKDGFRIFVRAGVVRPMTQEELLSIIPRKVHMTNGLDGWLCKTAHVSPKNVTSDATEVTCKLCLKVMG